MQTISPIYAKDCREKAAALRRYISPISPLPF
nr:MAG TPA: hypothetical protein [Caudoviricetes sp.]